MTPAAGFVTPIPAILIGSITAFCCFFAISIKSKLQIDDSLDAFPVHGVGGAIGVILTGVFATTAVNSAGADGLLLGNAALILKQLAAVGITYVIAGAGTFILLMFLEVTVGLRVKQEVELEGMDSNEHYEAGYGKEFV